VTIREIGRSDAMTGIMMPMQNMIAVHKKCQRMNAWIETSGGTRVTTRILVDSEFFMGRYVGHCEPGQATQSVNFGVRTCEPRCFLCTEFTFKIYILGTLNEALEFNQCPSVRTAERSINSDDVMCLKRSAGPLCSDEPYLFMADCLLGRNRGGLICSRMNNIVSAFQTFCEFYSLEAGGALSFVNLVFLTAVYIENATDCPRNFGTTLRMFYVETVKWVLSFQAYFKVYLARVSDPSCRHKPLKPRHVLFYGQNILVTHETRFCVELRHFGDMVVSRHDLQLPVPAFVLGHKEVQKFTLNDSASYGDQ